VTDNDATECDPDLSWHRVQVIPPWPPINGNAAVCFNCLTPSVHFCVEWQVAHVCP